MRMIGCLGWCFMMVCSTTLVAAEPTSSTIQGEIVDLPPGVTAFVFLCDQKTGLPVPHAPLPDNRNEFDWSDFQIAKTDATAAFQFQNVPPGIYRVFSQSWKDVHALPEKLIDRTSSELTVHGVLDNIVVPQKAAQSSPIEIVIRPLGDRTVRLNPTPAEAGAIVLVSQGKTLGHPSGSVVVWGDQFLSQLVLFTVIHHPNFVIHGLPAETELTLSAFYYDNNPGSGGTFFQAKQETVDYFVYAGWSNGHKEPLDEFKELVQLFEDHPQLLDNFDELTGVTEDQLNGAMRSIFFGKATAQTAWDQLGGADKLISIPDHGEFRLIDLVMGKGFYRMQESNRKSSR